MKVYTYLYVWIQDFIQSELAGVLCWLAISLMLIIGAAGGME